MQCQNQKLRQEILTEEINARLKERETFTNNGVMIERGSVFLFAKVYRVGEHQNLVEIKDPYQYEKAVRESGILELERNDPLWVKVLRPLGDFTDKHWGTLDSFMTKHFDEPLAKRFNYKVRK